MKKFAIICKCIFDTFYIRPIHISKFDMETTESMLASLQDADDLIMMNRGWLSWYDFDDFDLLNGKET